MDNLFLISESEQNTPQATGESKDACVRQWEYFASGKGHIKQNQELWWHIPLDTETVIHRMNALLERSRQ